MQELAYGSVKYFFMKAEPEDFKHHYCNLNSTKMLLDAIAVAHFCKIRPAIRDAIFDIVYGAIDLSTLISCADGPLIFDREIGIPSAQVRRWLQAEVDATLNSFCEDTAESIAHQDLLRVIRTGTREQFYQIIRFLRVRDELVDDLPPTIVIAIAKRLQHFIGDDCLYYSILANSVILSTVVETIYTYHYGDDDDDEGDYDYDD